MTNYQKIKAILHSWHLALAKTQSDDYIMYSSIEQDWDLRGSYYRKAIEQCYDSLWAEEYDEKDINLKSITISVRARPLWYPQVWDMVQILDTVQDLECYDGNSYPFNSITGWPFKVKQLSPWWCEIWSKDRNDSYFLDYRVLAPYIPPEQTIVLDWVEYILSPKE